MPNDLIATKPTVTMAAARIAMEAAEGEAKRNGWLVSVAVVDASGHLIGFTRMDGASPVSIEAGIAKARSAAQLGTATKTFQDMVDGGRASILAARNVFPLQGGVPIIVGGVVVGAVAASGVQAPQDEQVAIAGADAVMAAIAK